MVYPRGEPRSDEHRLHADLDERGTVWVVQGRLWDEPGSERLISILEDRAPAVEQREFPGSIQVSLHRVAREGPGPLR
jgi:hypothetical protein